MTATTAATFRHRIEYAIVVVVRALAGSLPEPLSRAMGTFIGLVFYAVDRAHRRIAIAQLRAAFPVRADRECRAIARRTFAHFGRLLVAVLRMSTLEPPEILRRVVFEGDERIRKALSAGKGAIIFVGHFGFWELHGLAHPLVLPTMSVLARPLDNPLLDVLLERMRCATGNRVIYRQGALRRVLRALQANEVVAIPIDQHIQGANAVTVDFFDRPAATTAALAMLALRTGAPVVPAFALPLPGGRYRLIYEHPVEPPAPGSADPIRELTQRCSDVLEMYVRRHPQLWLWMHRRWRSVPSPADSVPGMFPAAAPDESEPAE
jgi:KDO2-lipid IV(A) lauroyltransferase